MLRSQRRVCGRLSLTIRYSDQIEVTKHERIKPETCWECDLSPRVVSLFQRCLRRRIRLRSLTVSMTGLTAYAEQGSLFEEPTPDQRQRERAKKLAVALDTLHARFGEQAIRYGGSLNASFVHLHTHSSYSPMPGVPTLEALCQAVRRQGAQSVALTDTNGLYGAIRFLDVARETGLKPILGAELVHGPHRAVLLAKTPAGYANLCRVLSARHSDESFDFIGTVAQYRAGACDPL